jgi:predicted Zn finger-like uncharacterized protein
MSLATRCPACNTVFRVLQDQLRVSEGWVRCGQCQEVFNALETLFDLSAPAEAGAPANPPPAVFTPPPPAPPAFTPPPTAIAPPPPVPAPPAPRPAPVFAAPSPTATTTTAAALHAPEPETEPPPDFAPTTPAHAGDPFDDIDTFTVIDGDNLGVEAEGPLPEDDWHSLPPPLPPAEEEARDMRFDAPPLPTRTASPTPAERAASFAAPVASARPTPTDPVDAFFSDEVDTVTAAAFEAAAEDTIDDDEDEQAPTPSRFVGPMPDWARTPSTQRKSKKGKSRLPPDSALAQEHQARHARRKRRKPEFVRQAERAALWRRPMVRVVLGMAALALGALLAGQVGYHYREPLSAQAPSLTPVLKAGCEWLQCKIGAPRVIERIRLDASDLTRTDQEQVLRFTADLHNTAEFAVRTPALDVSFTDALGRIVSRKVLLPKELGARGESIAPDTQWRIDARLSVGELQVAGYTVEVFYP